LTERPDVKDRTKDQCRESMKILRATLPVRALGAEWSRREAAAWWSKIGTQYSASVANKLHGLARGMVKVMIEAGIRSDDLTKDLGRMKQPKSKLDVPSIAQMREMVASIASAGKRGCVQSSRMVAFLAFSGLRKGELSVLTWQDISDQWVTIGADGDTKGAEFRMVPISGPLREVIDGMRKDILGQQHPQEVAHRFRWSGVPGEPARNILLAIAGEFRRPLLRQLVFV
jgi:integrase